MTNRAVFLLSLAAFASAASLRATDTLLPQLAAEFSVTAGSAASVVTAFAISYGLRLPRSLGRNRSPRLASRRTCAGSVSAWS